MLGGLTSDLIDGIFPSDRPSIFFLLFCRILLEFLLAECPGPLAIVCVRVRHILLVFASLVIDK